MSKCLTCKTSLLGGTYCATHEPSRLKRLQHFIYYKHLPLRFRGAKYNTDNDDDMIALDELENELRSNNAEEKTNA